MKRIFLILIFLVFLMLLTGSVYVYRKERRFEKGVIEPTIAYIEKKNCIECFEQTIECLARQKIPVREWEGYLYISERDYDLAIMVCS